VAAARARNVCGSEAGRLLIGPVELVRGREGRWGGEWDRGSTESCGAGMLYHVHAMHGVVLVVLIVQASVRPPLTRRTLFTRHRLYPLSSHPPLYDTVGQACLPL